MSIIKTRIMNKRDTESQFLSQDFIPLAGEFIIYAADDTHNYERIKIGDGNIPVSELPFVNEIITDYEIDTICRNEFDVIILEHPVDQIVTADNKVTFSVKAAGHNLIYQWQYMDPSTTNGWANSSFPDAKTNTITFVAETHRNGYKYRCVIKDDYDNQVISEEAVLTISSN